MIIHNSINPIRIEQIINDDKYYHFIIDSFSSTTDSLPTEAIDLVKYHNYKIIFDLSYEGWINTPEIVYNLFIEPYQLKNDQFVILSGSVSAQDDANIFCRNKGIPSFKSIWHLPMMINIAKDTLRIKHSLYHQDTLKFHFRKFKKFEKCFLNFNRRWRLHRPALVGLLKIKNLLDKGYVSLTNADDNVNWSTIFDQVSIINKSSYEFTNIWQNNRQNITSTPNLTLDFNSLQNNKADLELTTNYFYENSFFSIVTETNFYQSISPSKFFSEKTFKPMAYKHPFILMTLPNSLPILRDLGFKTFSPFINEDYDNILDDTERLFKILEEIERLCNFNEKDLSTFIENITPIVNHNYEMLLQKVVTKP